MSRSVLGGGNSTPRSLAEMEQQLWDWEVPQMMWNCAKKRGMGKSEFTVSYHDFVETFYRQTNNRGELALGTIDRALYRGWIWLRDQTDYASLKHKLKTSPEWKDAKARSKKTGRNLGWRVYVNTEVS